MKQLTQKLKSGAIMIQTLPMPVVSAGMVLVRNHYSVISAGTEISTIKAARKSLIGKARERPEQARQVVDSLKKQGPVRTYRNVMKKLEAYSPLGYSCAGKIIDVGAGVTQFAVGDKVACAGAGYANHAEVVCVPVNLCVKLQQDTNLQKASYNTLGAIALQGIRQADLRLGENCAVIGIGLIGHLTCLMLRASGVHTYGIDIDPVAVELARKYCADRAWVRSDAGITEQIKNLTGGLGVDAVIITAGTSSLDPINLAGEIVRKKGLIVVVGVVPTAFNRDPYYKKELELRMSCSYGPGRYDLNYEEKGIDYPAAYVRWSENRNMQAFQELVHSGRIDLDYLTTHKFPLDQAPKVYDMILERAEPFLGVVIEYDTDKPLERQPVVVNASSSVGMVGIAFIGAGSYAQGSLLPNIPRKSAKVVCKGIMTHSGTTSKRVAERYGFEFCTSNLADILGNVDINTVFIVTRHDSHAEYVLKTLKAGKHVFVEKPLCLNVEELRKIENVYYAGHEGKHFQLMIGFNRRFAPHAVALKQQINEGPVAMIYRVNAGAIPKDTWIQDPKIGGGRVIGEVCHFIDFLTFICGALPVRVYASALPDPHHLNDTVTINLDFANGSVGTVCYFANGSEKLPKEYVEVYQSGLTGIIRDFKEVEIFGKSKWKRKKFLSQDKGQGCMLSTFIDRVSNGGAPLIKPDEIFAVTKATFGVLESLQSRKAVFI